MRTREGVSLPGFSAGSSLDRPRGQYAALLSAEGGGFATLAERAEVVPALIVHQMPRNCFTMCDGSGQCTIICVPDPF